MPETGENDDQRPIPRAPAGLNAAGKRFWREITSECEIRTFDMLMLVEQAARTADVVARLQRAVDTAESLRCQGSKGQEVAIPELTELRQYRAQFAALIKQLDLPAPEDDEDEDEDSAPGRTRPMTRSEAGRKAAAARWQKSRGGTAT
ncbi:hypothetical protein U8D42_17240 [Mycobacterium europaeum]|uniref:hypothetical protein n=1 Tax=Mycobacterium europaeum TaxID=761804 RepID=UPI002ADF5F3F|nr:hypothetical protein [Mycobacterium europaeum]MEA1159788.1 hypothetical protein [Mycobacterium europaeum]